MAESEYLKENVELNREMRDLMKDLVRTMKGLNAETADHAKTTSSMVKDYSKMVTLQESLQHNASQIASIENSIHNLTKKRATMIADLKKNTSIALGLERSREKEKLILDKAEKSGNISVALSQKVKIANLTRELAKRTEILRTSKLQYDIVDAKLKKEKESLKTRNIEHDVLKSQFILMKAVQKSSEATVSFYNKIWNIFKEIDTEMFSLRKQFGLFRDESQTIEHLAKSLNRDFAEVGVTIGISSASIKSIGDNFGRISSASEETFRNVALLSAQFGISEKTSSDVLKNFAGISGTLLKDVSKGMLGFTKELSTAAGTNLNDVMSDIANASDTVRSTFRGNTAELIKTTVEARRMGLSLESMAKTADGLLDFNSSVNAEMEASVLLGKNLNLNEARRRAWVGDILGANKEILRVVKSAGDFDKMNVMQRKSLAAAVGKSVEELQKMVAIDKEIAHVTAYGTTEQKEQLALYKKRLEMNEQESKDLGLRFQKRAQMEANQERMNILTQQFNKLLLEAGQPLLELVDPLIELAKDVLPTITALLKENPGLLKGMILGFSSIATIITATKLMPAISFIASTVTLIGKGLALAIPPLTSFVGGFLKLSAAFASSAAGITAILGTVVAWLGYWTGDAIYKMFTDPIDRGMDWVLEKWGLLCEDIVGGIVSVGADILKALIWPFYSFGKWLAEATGLLGESPSGIGLAIVNGLTSVGSMILKALTSPFTSAFSFITELFGRIPEFITGVFKRGFDFVTKLPGIGLLTKAIDTFSGNKSTETVQKVESVQTKQDDTNRLILEKLTELTNLMRSGGIAINIDGRRMSEALAHAS